MDTITTSPVLLERTDSGLIEILHTEPVEMGAVLRALECDECKAITIHCLVDGVYFCPDCGSQIMYTNNASMWGIR
jgi:uncharacterized Zn finger protein (UPF0148 family)